MDERLDEDGGDVLRRRVTAAKLGGGLPSGRDEHG
jgi:hypothetical protein